MNEYKTGYVAKWIKQHENTVRDWGKRFAPFMSERARKRRRKYTDEDVRLLATVADYRNQGLSFEAIQDALEAGKRLSDEDMPDEPIPDIEDAKQDVKIIQIPENERLLEIQAFQHRIETLANERDSLKERLETSEADNKDLRARLSTVESELSAASAKLEIIESERKPASYWLIIVVIIAISAILVTAGVLLSVLQ